VPNSEPVGVKDEKEAWGVLDTEPNTLIG